MEDACPQNILPALLEPNLASCQGTTYMSYHAHNLRSVLKLKFVAVQLSKALDTHELFGKRPLLVQNRGHQKNIKNSSNFAGLRS